MGAVTDKIGGAGGRRVGAGRNKKVETQLAEARDTIKELEGLVKAGIRKAAISFEQIVDDEVETALESTDPKMRMQARHFLIQHVMSRVPMIDVSPDTPFAGVMAMWEERRMVITDGVDSQGERPPVLNVNSTESGTD